MGLLQLWSLSHHLLSLDLGVAFQPGLLHQTAFALPSPPPSTSQCGLSVVQASALFRTSQGLPRCLPSPGYLLPLTIPSDHLGLCFLSTAACMFLCQGLLPPFLEHCLPTPWIKKKKKKKQTCGEVERAVQIHHVYLRSPVSIVMFVFSLARSFLPSLSGPV